jgi:hypothetical protein
MISLSNDYQENRINRCQPGHGASCALCCGSHNFALPPEDIEELFLVRGCGSPERPIRHPEEARAEKLFRDEMQCPNMGMQSSDPGLVCCLVYMDHDRGEEIESFFTGTCKNFHCPAWYNLTDRQVLFAARLMGDWYYYSLFINHIEAVHDICAAYGEPEDVPYDELCSLKMELEERFLEEDGK